MNQIEQNTQDQEKESKKDLKLVCRTCGHPMQQDVLPSFYYCNVCGGACRIDDNGDRVSLLS